MHIANGWEPIYEDTGRRMNKSNLMNLRENELTGSEAGVSTTKQWQETTASKKPAIFLLWHLSVLCLDAVDSEPLTLI
jgi:hypothetical protein